MGTFDMQLSHMHQTMPDINQRHNYARLFTLITACGIIFIPIVGMLMDKSGFPTTSTIITLSGALWGVCLLSPTPYTLLLSFIFYSFYRTSFFIFIFGYLADSLGYRFYGLLAGIMFLCGGCIGMLQYPLATFALDTCNSHHTSSINTGVDDTITGADGLWVDDNCYQGQWYQVHVVMVVMILSTLHFSYQDQVRRSIIAEHIKALESIRNSRIPSYGTINVRIDKSPQWR